MMDPTFGADQVLVYAGIGLAASLGGMCLQGDRFRIPVMLHDSGSPEWEPGFAGRLIAGTVLAVIAAGNASVMMLPDGIVGPRGFIAALVGLAVGMGGKAVLRSLLSPLGRLVDREEK